MYVNLYVPYPLESKYTYAVPEHMNVLPGMRVKVNFAGRVTTGYVVEATEHRPDDFDVKNLIEVIDDEPIFDSKLITLAGNVASAYLSSAGEVLSLALPSGMRASDRYAHPFDRPSENDLPELTREQNDIFNEITGNSSESSTHLIFGITGSGKTRVYIELARDVILRGRSVIFLVPEISLSSQVFGRLYSVFGDELIIYHSHLTGNQRLHNWKKFYSGQAKIAVGTRSSIFLQCPDLGLIIIDEEHDGSYKEHSTPRYNARRIAMFRSKDEHARVVMGSATPSLESLYAAERKILSLHRLSRRYGGAKLPDIEIIRVHAGKQTDMLSPQLKLLTKKAVDRGEQAIFLLNRRGFSPLVLCDSCGAVVECPHCNISLCYHKGDEMICHYCGYKRKMPQRCDSCYEESLIKIGSGTQKVEDSIAAVFPDMKVFRLDQDTSRKKGTVYDLIDKMNSGEIDILLGTQMVAKGFDFHNVTVVGVLMADIGINLPDFRAPERIFSLLMQVAGRSGRGSLAGKVIIQAINTSHDVFKYIGHQDYQGFYRSEIETRKLMGYPPFTRIARLLVRGKDEQKVIESMEQLRDALISQIAKADNRITLLGPSSAPFAKIGGNYRYHIILKSAQADILRTVIHNSRKVISGRDVYLEIDIDPYDML